MANPALMTADPGIRSIFAQLGLLPTDQTVPQASVMSGFTGGGGNPMGLPLTQNPGASMSGATLGYGNGQMPATTFMSSQAPVPGDPKGMFANPLTTPGGNSVAPSQPISFPGDPASLNVDQASMPTPAVPKPSFFQTGGLGGHVLDGISAFANTELAAQGNPAGLAWVKGQQEQRAAAQESTKEQASQLAKLQQFLFEQQYKQQHPEPGSIEKNDRYFNSVDPTGKLSATYRNAEANPQTLATNPATGGVQFVPKGGYPAQSGPTAAAIAYLKTNPALAAQFDAKYGAGASKSVLGGGAGPGQPTFP